MVTAALHEIDEMGPVDYLVVEFPNFTMTGEGMAQLLDLVNRGIIRILDLAFVRKDPDGKISVVAINDLDGHGRLGLAAFEGASSGLLDSNDIEEAAGALEPGSAGGVLVYENLWAAPLARTLRRGGARLVAGGRIPVPEILTALEATETAKA